MFGILKKMNPFSLMKGNEGNQDDNHENQQQQQHSKKDDETNLIIDFQIDPMENIPRVFQYTNGKPDEEAVDFIPDIYTGEEQQSKQEESKEYDDKDYIDESKKKEEDDEYIYYKVTQNDTLYLIADKFKINVGKIMKINELYNDNIFTGQTLKIPKELLEMENSDEGRKSLHQKNKSISQSLIEDQKKQKQFQCYYCTGYGKILGKLVVKDNFVQFIPDLHDFENQKKMKKKSVKFNVTIDVQDINEAITLTLPPPADLENVSEDDKDYAVQICLSSINREISQKYQEKLRQLKEQKKSISFVTFRMYEYNIHGTNYSNDEKSLLAQGIVETVNQMLVEYQNTSKDLSTQDTSNSQQQLQQSSQTIVPFYDILYDNLIEKEDSNDKKKKKRKNIWEQLGIEPHINAESKICTKAQFLQIVQDCVPSVFMMNNWQLIYSNWQNGTSLNTLYRNCEDYSPVLIIVSEFNGHFFGAYLTDPLCTGFKFTGSGECCVFKRLKTPIEDEDDDEDKQQQSENKEGGEEEEQKEGSEKKQKKQKFDYDLEVYQATGENQNFIYCDHDGIGIGCGDRYAFYIKNTLFNGNSNESLTFNNPRLATKEDYEIDNVEVWGLDI